MRVLALLALMLVAGGPVTCGAVLGVPPVAAQSAPAPFASFDIGLGLLADVNHATFHDYWDPGLGVEFRLAAPLYAGDVELGVQQFHNAGDPGVVPGFRSRFFHAGWGVGVPLASRLRWRGGGQVGIYHMRFDDDTIPFFERSESELGLGATATLEYAFASRWHLAVTGRYQLILTHQRIHRVLVGVGLSRRFKTPSWLRALLE